MEKLTIKKINAAIAAEGINLVLKKGGDYHPFYYDGPGVELIHHSSVIWGSAGPIKTINAVPLETWLHVARRYAAYITEQHARIKLPDWIKVGNSVVIADGTVKEATIKRIYSDGSERAKIQYEDFGVETCLWGNGEHCTGPVVFRDREAYTASVNARARMLQMLSMFGKLSENQQLSIIEQVKQQLTA